MLTERENALRAILGTDTPEWVPVSTECFDTVFINATALNEQPDIGQNGYDWFGCHWTYDAASHGHAQTPGYPVPISDITQWKEQLVFPDIENIDWETHVKKDLANIDRENKLLRIFWVLGPFERLHTLTGFEEAFIAMYEEPEAFTELIDAITDFKIRLLYKIVEHYKPDVIFTMDDLGSVNGPLMSHDMYEEMIKPAHLKFGKAIRDTGVIYEQHSDGCIQSFVGDFIEAGAQLLQPVQGGDINDLDYIKNTYGGQITVDGALSLKTHYPETTEDELRQEVRHVIDLFAPSKRYIFHPASFIPGNAAIMIDEAKKYGKDYWNRHNLK